jgi:hypothetical protein
MRVIPELQVYFASDLLKAMSRRQTKT